MTPDYSEALKFQQAFTGQDDPVCTFVTFTDNKANRVYGHDPLAKTFHGNPSDLFPTLAELNRRGAGVYYTANETDGAGRKKKNIKGIQAVWQDDDTGHGWNNDAITPSITVQTSEGKFQRLFLTASKELGEFDAVQAVIVARHGSDPNATGISRLLRLPGFYHMKDPDNPFMVHVVGDINPERKSWEDIKAAFPPGATTRQAVPPAPPATVGRRWPIGKIYAALQHISPEEYKTWVDVGMAIHHASGGSDEGLELWEEWSKSSSKWTSGECAAKWKTFGRS